MRGDANNNPLLKNDRVFRFVSPAAAVTRKKAVDDILIHELYELMKWDPTRRNCTPRRQFWCVVSGSGRVPSRMSDGAVNKFMISPVRAFISVDMKFSEKLA
jgi:3-hydroxypropanoate dehydrogenase